MRRIAVGVVLGILITVLLLWKWQQPHVRILWPTSDVVVSGLINVVVDAGGGGCIKSLTLMVDGNDLSTVRDGPMEFHLPTNYFTNGIHTISVRAFGNARWHNAAISSPIRVGFQNDVTIEWQPLFGTRLPIRARLVYPEADWSILIKNDDGTSLRTISGVSTNGNIDVVWDAKDEHGNDVPAGVHYFLTVEATPRGSSRLEKPWSDTSVSTQPAAIKPGPNPPWCKPVQRAD